MNEQQEHRPVEVEFAATATASLLKPILVYYHDGTIKDFTAEEAVANGLGMSHTIAQIVFATGGDTSFDLGFVNDAP